jgi:ribosomal protein L16/L10AE
MVCLPGMSGGKGNPEGKPARLEKLNAMAWIRDRLNKKEPGSVTEMHKAIMKAGFALPIGTFKNYVTEAKKSLNGHHPDGNSARS